MEPKNLDPPSEQDLKYAAELRDLIHQKALEKAQEVNLDVELEDIIDPYGVEDYFQQVWEYPGAWYRVVAIPYGFKSRNQFIDTIVKDTLAYYAAKDKEQ